MPAPPESARALSPRARGPEEHETALFSEEEKRARPQPPAPDRLKRRGGAQRGSHAETRREITRGGRALLSNTCPFLRLTHIEIAD